jgi:hypothetical protein
MSDPKLTLTSEELGSQFVKIGFTSVPADTKHLRAFAIEKDGATTVQSLNVPRPLTNSGFFLIENLTNGLTYDVQLVAYTDKYAAIKDTASLNDIIPAGLPSKPTISGKTFIEGKKLSIDINCGAYSGADVERFSVTIFDDFLNSFETVIASNIVSTVKESITLYDIKTVDLSGLYEFVDGRDYALCAASINKIGVSEASLLFALKYKNIPDQAVSPVLTLGSSQDYKVEWTNGADAEEFSGLQYSLTFHVKYRVGVSATDLFKQFSAEPILIDAAAKVYPALPLPADGEVREKYAASNSITKTITPGDIKTRFEQLGISDVRKFILFAKVVTVAGVNSSLPKDSSDLKTMNISSVDSTVKSFPTLTATGFRNPTKITLDIEIDEVEKISLATAAAGIFTKVKFYTTFKQKDTEGLDVLTNNSKEIPIETLKDTINITPAGTIFSSSDILKIRYTYIGTASIGGSSQIYESPFFEATDKRPIIPSVASNNAAAECRVGKVYFEFDLENGTSDSVKSNISLRVQGQTTRELPNLTVNPITSNPGRFYVEADIPASVGDGAEVDVRNTMSDVVGTNSTQFFTTALDVNNKGNLILNLTEDYTNILNDARVVYADTEPDPQKTDVFSVMVGFNKVTMGKAQSSNRDRVPPTPDASELLLDLPSGTTNTVRFSLKTSSATYARHSQSSELDKLAQPLSITVGLTGSSSIVLVSEDSSKLDKVLAVFGFTGSKSDYFWVEVLKSNLASNVQYSMNLLAKRTISGQEFSTGKDTSFKIVDAVRLPASGDIETTKKALAFPLVLKGEPIDLCVRGIAVQGSANSNVGTIPTITKTITQADLTTDGFIVLKFLDTDPDMAAFVIAIATNTRGNSLDVAIRQNQNPPAFTTHLPLPAPAAPVGASP